MKVLIVGVGLVGKGLAESLVADGHHVVGTTTTESKVKQLQQICTDVAVLRGSETDKLHAAAEGCDAIAVTAGPAAQRAMTVQERAATYHEVLVATAQSVSSAPGNPRIVALSSLSVYGDAANHLDRIDEDSPLTTDPDPSPQKFQEAERTYRDASDDRTAIFRCSDILGGEDPPVRDKIKMAIDMLGGSVPFHDDALFYRVHMLDVVRAIRHAIDERLVGTYNLTHADVPPSNKECFDAVCDAEGWERLTFRNELRGPAKPVSTDRLQATGFKLEHTVPETL